MNYRTPLLLCALAAAGCSSDAARPVTIAAAGPWTQSGGAVTKQGIQFAVDEINAAGGIRGRRLELITRDDEGGGTKAAVIAQEFVDDQDIVGVVGHVNSGAMVAAARVYDGHLASLTEATAYHGITGPISFLPTGDPAQPAFHITRIHHGVFLVTRGAGQ